jgi:hypothetical protein
MRVTRFRLSRKKTRVSFVKSVRLSVCLHLPARLPLDGFSWNFILGTSTKICRETPDLLKIGHCTWIRKYIYCWQLYEVFCSSTTSAEVNHCSSFLAKMVTRTRDSVTLYVHCLFFSVFVYPGIGRGPCDGPIILPRCPTKRQKNRIHKSGKCALA